MHTFGPVETLTGSGEAGESLASGVSGRHVVNGEHECGKLEPLRGLCGMPCGFGAIHDVRFFSIGVGCGDVRSGESGTGPVISGGVWS